MWDLEFYLALEIHNPTIVKLSIGCIYEFSTVLNCVLCCFLGFLFRVVTLSFLCCFRMVASTKCCQWILLLFSYEIWIYVGLLFPLFFILNLWKNLAWDGERERGHLTTHFEIQKKTGHEKWKDAKYVGLGMKER